MGLCVLSHIQMEDWEKTSIRPDCKNHVHTTYTKIIGHLINDEAVFYPEKRAIVIYDCVRGYEWRAKKSLGFSILQMVPIRK